MATEACCAVEGSPGTTKVPYRVLDKDYLSQQLPQLQERAPKSQKSPLEFISNAPSTLPTAHLFPGEVLRLQQHRVMCSNKFTEPAVGALYLTNFRMIFSGNLITDPEVFDTVHDMQFHHMKKEPVGDLHNVSHGASTLKDPKRKAGKPLRRKPTFSSYLADDNTGDDQSAPHRAASSFIPSKMFHRLESIRKTTGAGIKSAIAKNKRPKGGGKQHPLGTHSKEDVVEATDRTGRQSAIDIPAPHKVVTRMPSGSAPLLIGQSDPQSALPANHAGNTDLRNVSCRTNDSGFVDPLHSPGNSLEEEEECEQANAAGNHSGGEGARLDNSEEERLKSGCPLSKQEESSEVFIENEEEIDFERAPGGSSRRFRRWKFFSMQYNRPDSVIVVESDSEDSDVTSDKYYGSFAEEEFTSPECSPSPSPPSSPPCSPAVMDTKSASFHIGGEEEVEMLVIQNGPSHLPMPSESQQQMPLTADGSDYGPHGRGDDDVDGSGIGGNECDPAGTSNKESRPSHLPIGTGKSPSSSTSSSSVGEITPSSASIQSITPSDEESSALPKKPPRRKRKGNSTTSENSPAVAQVSKEKKDSSEERQPLPSFPLMANADVCEDSPKMKRVHSDEKPKPSPRNARANQSRRAPPSPPVKPRVPRTAPKPDHSRSQPSPLLQGTTVPEKDNEVESSLEKTLVSPDHSSHDSDLVKTLKREPSHDSDLVRTLKREPSPVEAPAAKKEQPRPKVEMDFLPHPNADSSLNSSSFGRCSGSPDTSKRRLTVNSPIEGTNHFDWARQNSQAGGPRGSNTWGGVTRGVFGRITQAQFTHSVSVPLTTIHSVKHLPAGVLDKTDLKVPDGILVLCKNFNSLRLHIHPQNTFDALRLKEALEKHFLDHKPMHESFAFQYYSAIRISNPHILNSKKLDNIYHFDVEFKRLGLLDSKLWRVTTIAKDKPELCHSYPTKLLVLICTPDVDLIRAAAVYHDSRFPTACWMHPDNGAVLLRAASTVSERGVQGSNLLVDEAILQAIRGCNKHERLCVFTERLDSVFNVQDPTRLHPEQARSYYYHNCRFMFTVNPPTFKSVRHSFNKLQAMLQNPLADDDYLVALDSTRWLARIAELLKTASDVGYSLCSNAAHVLVCYESGWDRTTQITSLAQLLIDPYYRTMDGFQILVQKEWLWFGHPFRSRHYRQGSKVKEDGPVFLQWVDCVWQVMRQYPLAFEFSENLLIAMVEHSYSHQFGTFLQNTERDYSQSFMFSGHEHKSVATHTVSFWVWVAMMNASCKVFFNPLYNSTIHKGVIYPRSYQVCLELWRTHYCREEVAKELQEGESRLQVELKLLLQQYQDLQKLPQDSIIKCRNLEVSIESMLSQTSVIGDDKRSLGSSPIPPSLGPSPVPTLQAPHQTVPAVRYQSIADYLRAEMEEDYSVCRHVEFSPTMCQGYLVKEGGIVKSWKKRWFVLDLPNQYLAYFESVEHYQNLGHPKGVIPLPNIQRVEQPIKRDYLQHNTFQVKTPKRTYNIKAPSLISMKVWIACLKIPPLTIVQNSGRLGEI